MEFLTEWKMWAGVVLVLALLFSGLSFYYGLDPRVKEGQEELRQKIEHVTGRPNTQQSGQPQTAQPQQARPQESLWSVIQTLAYITLAIVIIIFIVSPILQRILRNTPS